MPLVRAHTQRPLPVAFLLFDGLDQADPAHRRDGIRWGSLAIQAVPISRARLSACSLLVCVALYLYPEAPSRARRYPAYRLVRRRDCLAICVCWQARSSRHLLFGAYLGGNGLGRAYTFRDAPIAAALMAVAARPRPSKTEWSAFCVFSGGS